MKPFLPLVVAPQLLLLLCSLLLTWSADALSRYHDFWQRNRPEILNLLNHPLQLQLATGDLHLGAFQRLILDRRVILQGLKMATTASGIPEIEQELALHDQFAEKCLARAATAGKTIVVPDIKCYNCGGNHLNLDCPDDQTISSSALALKSLLASHGLTGATAVLQCYGFCCRRLLEACSSQEATLDPVYHGWLERHAKVWSQLGNVCAGKLVTDTTSGSLINADGFTVCISMLYNWIDGEAATTGIRADLNEPTLSALLNTLEGLEPGYVAQRDKHQSFVSDLNGTKTAQVAQSKADKAAASLAAKQKRNFQLDTATAYLAKKKKQEGAQ